MMSALISAEELLSSIQDVKIIDATYADNGRQGWKTERIGSAVFFDIDEIADPDSDMAHMLPSAGTFAESVSKLGISNSDDIVVYDQGGMASAACRAWWMFRVFGHDRVRVLDGGLPFWKAKGYPINESSPGSVVAGTFRAAYRPQLVQNMKDVLQSLENKSSFIIDARSAQRFSGAAAEPRPGLRSGHIPGSMNTPYATLLDPVSGCMKESSELKKIFASVPAGAHVVASCGSGVTACVLALGLYELGRGDVAVYDGSWTEWGRESSQTPVEQQL